MAYIILAGKRDTDQGEAVNKMGMSDADYDRVAYWGAKTYFPSGVSVPGDPAADPPIPDSVRMPTGEEVFKAITDRVYGDIKREVETLFLREAEEKARSSVLPIELVPSVK